MDDYGQAEKPLLRKTPDGRFLEWKVLVDDSLCTLKEAFDKVDRSLGFNIELKFNDEIDYSEDQLRHDLEVIIEVTNLLPFFCLLLT